MLGTHTRTRQWTLGGPEGLDGEIRQMLSSIEKPLLSSEIVGGQLNFDGIGIISRPEVNSRWRIVPLVGVRSFEHQLMVPLFGLPLRQVLQPVERFDAEFGGDSQSITGFPGRRAAARVRLSALGPPRCHFPSF